MIDDEANRGNWAKKSKVELNRFSYYEMSLILSYCDVDTQLSLLDIQDSFVWISNVMGIKANLESFEAQLQEASDHDQDILASWQQTEGGQAAELLDLAREVENEASQVSVDRFGYSELVGNKRLQEIAHLLQMFVDPR